MLRIFTPSLTFLFIELEKIQDMEKGNELQAGAVGVLAEECGR